MAASSEYSAEARKSERGQQQPRLCGCAASQIKREAEGGASEQRRRPAKETGFGVDGFACASATSGEEGESERETGKQSKGKVYDTIVPSLSPSPSFFSEGAVYVCLRKRERRCLVGAVGLHSSTGAAASLSLFFALWRCCSPCRPSCLRGWYLLGGATGSSIEGKRARGVGVVGSVLLADPWTSLWEKSKHLGPPRSSSIHALPSPALPFPVLPLVSHFLLLYTETFDMVCRNVCAFYWCRILITC